MHYGVYNQLGKDAWAMFGDKIHVKEYTKLKDTFDPSGFDADMITDLAIEANLLTICYISRD